VVLGSIVRSSPEQAFHGYYAEGIANVAGLSPSGQADAIYRLHRYSL